MLTSGSVFISYMERKVVTETEDPPISSPPETPFIEETPSQLCLIPKQKTSKTVYHLCKCIMRPVQMELLLLGKSDLSRRREELRNFRHCIRRLGRHIQSSLRKFCKLSDREVWEANLWEYACLYTVFDRLQLRILYRNSRRNFNSFKTTYEKLRFNFLATQLLIGSCDLQQLYGAWHLCGACICPDCRLTSLNCTAQNRQMQREMSGDDARPDSGQGLSKTAVSRAMHHGCCSPDTQGHSLRNTSRPNTEGASMDSLKQRCTE